MSIPVNTIHLLFVIFYTTPRKSIFMIRFSCLNKDLNDWLIDWLNNFQNSGNILLHFGKESLYIFKLCACRRTRIDQKQYAWRLQYNFRSIIFFKSGFLSQNIGWSVVFIFLLKKKILKKTEYWQRNRGFTFSPEVKVYPLIDSPMMLCNQPRRLSRDYTDVKNWLLSWSATMQASSLV